MSTEIPLKLVLQHRATMSAMLLGLVRSSLPFMAKYQQGYEVIQRGHTPDARPVCAGNQIGRAHV